MAKVARKDDSKLQDDVLLDIFQRVVGFLDIIRCAATCKQWCRLVTDRTFLRRIGLWPENANRPSILVGIFSSNAPPFHDIPNDLEPLNREPQCPPQFSGLESGTAHFVFDSVVANDNGLFNHARPMASRGGLLLFEVFLPQPVGDYRNMDQQKPTFQVILTYRGDDRFVHACTYFSTTNSWSAPIKCCKASKFLRCGPLAGVVVCGTAYWLYRDNNNFYTLGISAAISHELFTRISIKVNNSVPWSWPRPPIPCIAGEGKLSFVNIQHHGVLELWTKKQQDCGDLNHECGDEWLHSQLMDLGSERIDLVYFAESKGALLIKQGSAFFTIDLKSKQKSLINLNEEEIEHVRGARVFKLGYCTSSSCAWGGHAGKACEHNPPVLYEMNFVFN
ncbi:hypothetical protein VPH35_039322 [Triticum aestivum]